MAAAGDVIQLIHEVAIAAVEEHVQDKHAQCQAPDDGKVTVQLFILLQACCRGHFHVPVSYSECPCDCEILTERIFSPCRDGRNPFTWTRGNSTCPAFSSAILFGFLPRSHV